MDTPLGPMLAISDQKQLYLLEFVDNCKLDYKLERLKAKTHSSITLGVTKTISSIKNELKSYFDGNLQEFKTPIAFIGTNFQNLTWKALVNVPYGNTKSYADLASSIDKPLAYRAVANANGTNQIAIVIPCHRIINSDGNLGGYAGGIERKKWLINHEQTMIVRFPHNSSNSAI